MNTAYMKSPVPVSGSINKSGEWENENAEPDSTTWVTGVPMTVGGLLASTWT